MKYVNSFDRAALDAAIKLEVRGEEVAGKDLDGNHVDTFTPDVGDALVCECGGRLFLCGTTEALARDKRARFYLVATSSLASLGLAEEAAEEAAEDPVPDPEGKS